MYSIRKIRTFFSVCALYKYAGTDVVSQNFSSNLTPRQVREFSMANVLLGIGVILNYYGDCPRDGKMAKKLYVLKYA